MGVDSQEAVRQLQSLMREVDGPLKDTFQNVHQGYPLENMVRFLKAREWNVEKAHKMLMDSLQWRVENGIDNILTKPIIPNDLYRAVRDSQLVGVSGYTKQGLPVIAIGVGHSSYDKASVNYYIQSHIQMNEYRDRVVLPQASKKQGRYIGTCVKILDMTGLRFSQLNQIQLLSAISSIDDLNYPEKTETYFIVNAPRIFSACWKVVKPLLQERTRRKVQVIYGSAKDELLKIMDYASLPHFCKIVGSGSSRHSDNGIIDDCFSMDHTFHQQLYNYIKEQALLLESVGPIRQGSVHVTIPDQDPEEARIKHKIESELHKLGNQNGLVGSMNGLTVNGN
ncbi:hypothetical protein MLD38_035073 [Melastoma candidum]|uniref:Uncharacterized protein n=1 Tax=Melastoma candidum TaxID=119954 RepID=A0ACB9MFN4_9MYRT|nr:hypothetical protein MLD38_035073 [Melastoma candidum]